MNLYIDSNLYFLFKYISNISILWGIMRNDMHLLLQYYPPQHYQELTQNM